MRPLVASSVTPDRPARWPGSSPPHLVPVLVAGATVVAVVAGNGNLALALAPTLIALFLWALWATPTRYTLLLLLALSWLVEAPGAEFGSGKVKPPWLPIGRVLWSKLNLVLPVPPLVFTGFDLLALLLFGVLIVRLVQRSPLDRTGWVDTPAPLGAFAWVSLLAVLWLCAWGMARGGAFRFVLWQSIKWIYVPLVYALMRQGLRGTQDAPTVGKIILGVGLVRAVEAIVVRRMYPSASVVSYATTHMDSVLFATCVAILAAMALEMPSRRTFKISLLLLPVYVWAMQANNRRLVYTELALAFLCFWLVTPWRPVKRVLARLGMLALVPLLLYGTVGWHRQGFPFGPVQKIRSMVDSKADASTLWRDMENFNLVSTYLDHPVLGSGFGHPMKEVVKLPDVTAAYELEPYIPHNSVLGLWAFTGLVGFALLWMIFPVGMFFTVRAYRWAGTPLERVTALGALASQVCYLTQGYGDLGFGDWGSVFTVATGYALVGKICIARGAWSWSRSGYESTHPPAAPSPS
ncbi:MAG TPA: O-antigen ligase family protein [Myxococcaceae bacterium]|nr:O-antigen ligase family protein [Myxococcaceae bacterium]